MHGERFKISFPLMPQPQPERELERRSFLLGWFPFLHRPQEELSGILFRVLRYGHSTRRFLVIHGDEDTARDVLTTYMNDHIGVAYVVTGKERTVDIQPPGFPPTKLDPNRMFSRAGAETNIRSLNPFMDVERVIAVLNFLDHEREKFLKRLIPPGGSRLFALHNNRDYSVRDELAASDRTSVKQPDLPRNFFLCTQPADFEVLSQSPFNVVLQSQPDPDDGSLSRLSARRGFRYINLECAIGEYEAQLERVRWLDDHLP
jgi:hypothetical protein